MMALTHARAKEVAEHGAAIANEAKRLYYRLTEFLTMNSNQAIDWAGNPKPSFLNESAEGNLDGLHFTRQQLSNLIGSLDQLRKVFANEAVTQGDHLGNINQVADSDA